ncbi:transposase [uncultured Clostridium sp.]|uniref:transposase n=1 Tax=uncultured Clostridium sp. TaxID=59620 RepID=UPI0025DF2575|nr:transposase [uncultured Clostridium sp.]
MNKYSPEEKIKLVKKIIEEKQSINSLSVSSGIAYQILRDWIRNYQSIGPDVFYKKGWFRRKESCC